MFVQVLLYLIAIVSLMILYKKEIVCLVVSSIVMVALIWRTWSKKHVWLVSIALGIFLSLITFVCVKIMHMWEHHHTKYGIPMWMPTYWIIVVFGVIYVFEFAKENIKLK